MPAALLYPCRLTESRRNSWSSAVASVLRSRMRTPLRSKRRIPAGRLDQLGRKSESNGWTAAARCSVVSESKNAAAALDSSSRPWAFYIVGQ